MMVEGLNLAELKNRLELGYDLKDFVIGDWEGETLFYHTVWHKKTIETHAERIVEMRLL